MKKSLIFLIIIIIIAVATYVLFLKPDKPIAILNVEQGFVQVKTNNDWVQAQNGMEIKKNTLIKTSVNSKASVIFFNNNIIRLDENTEISVNEMISKSTSDKISIYQNSGQTWTKIIKLSGVETDYEIQTPTTIASVRGTAFTTQTLQDGSSKLLVSKGNVKLSSYRIENEKLVIIGTRDIKESEKINVTKSKLDELIVERKTEVSDWERENLEKDEQFRREARVRRMLQKSFILRQLMKQNNLSFQELVDLLEKYEKGEIELKIFTQKGEKLQELTKKQLSELIKKVKQEEVEE